MQTIVAFTVNGEAFEVSSSAVSIDTTLNTFIRMNAGLTGTKFMCLEGGCGACMVSVRAKSPVDSKYRTFAVNSCMKSIFSCHGYEITTVEGVGNRIDGYHNIQTRLAKFNGSQCGHCAPGVVMNMYALLADKDARVSQADVEHAFDGNVCRCTGYRSILDAFKSMASDASQSLIDRCADIEDLGKICAKRTNHHRSSGWSTRSGDNGSGSQSLRLQFDDDDAKQWLKVLSLGELFECLATVGDKEYQLVAGNTANGVYGRNTDVQVYIDVNDVVELRSHLVTDDNLVVGAGMTITDAIDIVSKTATIEGFGYFKRLAAHMEVIGNVAVRNAGTLAGNLSIKHQSPEFNSDLFILLETVGSVLYVTATDSEDDLEEIGLIDYLNFDMSKKIILNVILPVLDDATHHFRSYKVSATSRCAQPYMIAAFLIEYKDECIKSARICYDSVEPESIHATHTEEYLVDKNIYTNTVLSDALSILSTELSVSAAAALDEYRKELTLALFFKFIVSTMEADSDVASKRGISSGKHEFATSADKWPLTKDVPNVDGLAQAAGEVHFINDIPLRTNELWAAFVPATVVNAKISRIDASDALKIPGVFKFLAASDIPGKNNFAPLIMPSVIAEEEIFVGVKSRVAFNGQPCGIILAETFDLANLAAAKVDVTYVDVKDNVIWTTLHEVLAANNESLFIPASVSKEAVEYGANTTRQITGGFGIGAQYDFALEPHTIICVPSQHGLDVYTASVWPTFTQTAIAEALNLPNNAIRIIPHLGSDVNGAGFTRSAQIACACALASYQTNRAVRFVLSLESTMSVVGKRHASHGAYNVEINDNGRIQRMKLLTTHDHGASANDSPYEQILTTLATNCYIDDAIDVEMRGAQTNTASTTFALASGTAECVAFIENIMEHIAFELNVDPITVRMANMREESPMRVMLPDFLTECHFYDRREQIEQHNAASRWVKRGIAVVPMEQRQQCSAAATACVRVCNADGTVMVAHNRCAAAGVNTKVAQVAAHYLRIPMDDVTVYRMDSLLADNACKTTDVSVDGVCEATRRACQTILERTSNVRSSAGSDIAWKELVAKCFEANIDLTAQASVASRELDPVVTCGVASVEIELDILTGCSHLQRVDILMDVGECLSPAVDAVQVESAFVMGIGHWLSESVAYDRENGEILTNSTMAYHAPGFKDIPMEFRVKFAKHQSGSDERLPSNIPRELPFCMAVATIFALRHAIQSARRDAGINEWFALDAPATPERVFMSSGNSLSEYKLTAESDERVK